MALQKLTRPAMQAARITNRMSGESRISGIQRRMSGIQSRGTWKCGLSISRTATLGIN
jgi:hypothetical protein